MNRQQLMPLYLQIFTHILTFHLRTSITMNAQHAPTGLRRSERLSKMKKTKNQQSAAPSTETSTQSKVDEPSEERTQLLARHEELTRKMLQLKGQLEEIKRKREELRLNHPINSEKFQKILLTRCKVAQAAVSESYYLYSDMIVDTYKACLQALRCAPRRHGHEMV
jgi:RNase adaptor protein for sRNA GlmZ degradation